MELVRAENPDFSFANTVFSTLVCRRSVAERVDLLKHTLGPCLGELAFEVGGLHGRAESGQVRLVEGQPIFLEECTEFGLECQLALTAKLRRVIGGLLHD